MPQQDTDTMTGSVILPGDRIVLSEVLTVSGYSGPPDAVNVDFSIESSGYVTSPDFPVPGSDDFTISGVQEHEASLLPSVTGEITSSFPDTLGCIALTALYRQNGVLVAAETTYLDNIRSNTPTPFQIITSTGLPEHDSVEVYAQNW